jgi:hypothetical protein
MGRVGGPVFQIVVRQIVNIPRTAPEPLPSRVQNFIDAVLETCAGTECAPVSVILFGSAAVGGFSGTVSDVDFILVLPDNAGPTCRPRLKAAVKELEIRHGIGMASSRRPTALESLVNRITGNDHSLFVCRREDLLSGDPGRILGLKPAQAFFVDRVVIPSIVLSAVTVRGEELLAQIHLPPIRRLDVFKAFFSLFNQVLLTAGLFPLLGGATGYAMGALKRSVHNCYVCCHGRRAALEEEIDFFQRQGSIPALGQLLSLRGVYRESFGFVLRCFPAAVRLHLRTALDSRFPRSVR